MAKDPAVLFYFDHWRGGTMTLSRFLKGCYMDLLDAQFNNGHLSLEEIKTVLGSDFGSSWPALQKKFKKDESGLFFNERMQLEIDKRKKFVAHQSENGKKGGRPKKTHGFNLGKASDNPLVNKNVDVDLLEEEKVVGKGEGFFMNQLPMDTELSKIEIINVQNFIKAVCFGKDISEAEVKQRWEAFKIDNFKKKDWKNEYEDVLSFFRHTVKKELNNQMGSSFNPTKTEITNGSSTRSKANSNNPGQSIAVDRLKEKFSKLEQYGNTGS